MYIREDNKNVFLLLKMEMLPGKKLKNRFLFKITKFAKNIVSLIACFSNKEAKIILVSRTRRKMTLS